MSDQSALQRKQEEEKPRVKVLQVIWQTKGFLWKEVRRRWIAVIVMLVLGVVLGIVPTFKSELESGVLQQIDHILRERARQKPNVAPPSLTTRFAEPVDRFARSDGRPDRDWTEQVTRTLFSTEPLKAIVWWYFVISIIGYALRVGGVAAKTHLQAHLFGRLRAEAAGRVLTTDTADLPKEANVAAQYSEIIQRGAAVVARTYAHFVELFEHGFAIVTAMIFVATRSGLVAAVFGFCVVIQVAISVSQGNRLRKRRKEYDIVRRRLMGRTDEILDKREVLLAWDQEEGYTRRLAGLTEDYARVDRSLNIWEATFDAASSVMNDLGRIGVLLVAVIVAAGLFGQPIENMGDAYFLIALYTRLLVPSMNIIRRYDDLKRTESVAATFLELLAKRHPEVKKKPALPAISVPPEIRFDRVSFSYDGKHEVLRECTFTVPAGKITLLVGPSGSGKTTVARLLFGFWRTKNPESSILIDGKPITTFASPQLRRMSSYIAQSDHIIDETIAENLAWAEPTPSPQAMVAALAAVELPDRLEDRADDLSLGQKQRLSLARLTLDDAPIAILDEPMTGLDAHLLHELLTSIPARLGGGKRTVLIISHQLAFIEIADHVVVLSHSGHVVEEGTPEQLRGRKDGKLRSMLDVGR